MGRLRFYDTGTLTFNSTLTESLVEAVAFHVISHWNLSWLPLGIVKPVKSDPFAPLLQTVRLPTQFELFTLYILTIIESS